MSIFHALIGTIWVSFENSSSAAHFPYYFDGEESSRVDAITGLFGMLEQATERENERTWRGALLPLFTATVFLVLPFLLPLHLISRALSAPSALWPQ